MRRRALVDTSFFFAAIVPDDPHHRDTQRLRDRAASLRLLTTNHVRGETWTLLRRREGHRMAVDFLDSLEGTGRIEVIDVDQELENIALSWLRRHDEREYSFVDATSFAFMRRNGIADALAFDGDFTAAGFMELRR